MIDRADPVSPRIAAVAEALSAGNVGALWSFWERITTEGTPLIEPIEGDREHSLATLVWHWPGAGEADEVRVQGGPEGFPGRIMKRLSGTDFFYTTYRVRNDLRTTYTFGLNVPLSSTDPSLEEWERLMARAPEVVTLLRPDPLNSRRFARGLGGTLFLLQSIVELPGAPPPPWITRRDGIPRGWIHARSLHSEILDSDRPVRVYTPPGYEESRGPYRLLLVLDGTIYLSMIPTHRILDNLLSEERIAPLVTVFIDAVDREVEFACHEPFADFVARELVPWVREQFAVSSDPVDAIVAGASASGVAAAHIGLRHSDVFGNVLVQSGGFSFGPGMNFFVPSRFQTFEPEWLTSQFAAEEKLPLRFYLDVGLLEDGHPTPTNFLPATRRLREVLDHKGYEVHYQEFNGDHDFVNWRGTLADGLIALAGK